MSVYYVCHFRIHPTQGTVVHELLGEYRVPSAYDAHEALAATKRVAFPLPTTEYLVARRVQEAA